MTTRASSFEAGRTKDLGLVFRVQFVTRFTLKSTAFLSVVLFQVRAMIKGDMARYHRRKIGELGMPRAKALKLIRVTTLATSIRQSLEILFGAMMFDMALCAFGLLQFDWM